MNITDEILANSTLRAIAMKFELQTAKGLAKYGHTVQPTTKTVEEWATHAQEEMIDSLVYLECLKTSTTKLQEDYENAMDMLRIIIDETTSYEDAERSLAVIRGMAREGLKGR